MPMQKLLDRLLSDLDVHVEPFALCAVSKDWRLGLPGPAGVMLHFVLQGDGLLRDTTGACLELEPSSLVVVPTGVKHSLESGTVRHEHWVDAPPQDIRFPQVIAGSLEDAVLIVACGLVRVRFGESLGLFEHLRDILVVDLSDIPQVNAAFRGILTEQSSPGPGSEAIRAALMTQSLVYLLRKLCKDDDCPIPWLAALNNPRLARAIDLVLEEPAARHTVDSLAEAAAMSRSAFAEQFSKAFARSPMHLVHHIRMQRAAQLLQHGGVSVDEVADRIGFSSRSHFSRAFKKHTGLSPRAFSVGAEHSVATPPSGRRAG